MGIEALVMNVWTTFASAFRVNLLTQAPPNLPLADFLKTLSGLVKSWRSWQRKKTGNFFGRAMLV